MSFLEDDDSLDAAMSDPRFLYHSDLIEGYTNTRKFHDAVRQAQGSWRFNVSECAASAFEELQKAPEPHSLEKANPFPVFDRVEFYDEDPQDKEHTHYYLVPNPALDNKLEEPRGSATGFIHSFFEHFDDKAQAKRITLQLMHNTRRCQDEYTAVRDKLEQESDKPLPSFFDEGTLRDVILRHTVVSFERESNAKTFDETAKQYSSSADFTLYLALYRRVLAKWEWGSASGTALHRAIELFLDNPLDVRWTNTVYHTVEFGYFLNLCRDLFINGTMRMVRCELRVADWRDDRKGTRAELRTHEASCAEALKELLCATYLAGSVDLICREESAPENELVLGDWKRSKKIWERAFGNKHGRGPCAEVPDCNLYHYYIQLNLYATMIELNTHYKITRMFIVVLHPNNENYLIYHVPDMRVVVHKMLVQRIKDNYSSVYVGDGAEDRRKRAFMARYLKNKRVDKNNAKELFGIEKYQQEGKDGINDDDDDDDEVIIMSPAAPAKACIDLDKE